MEEEDCSQTNHTQPNWIKDEQIDRLLLIERVEGES